MAKVAQQQPSKRDSYEAIPLEGALKKTQEPTKLLRAFKGFFGGPQGFTVDSRKLEHGRRTISVGFPSIFGLGLGLFQLSGFCCKSIPEAPSSRFYELGVLFMAVLVIRVVILGSISRSPIFGISQVLGTKISNFWAIRSPRVSSRPSYCHMLLVNPRTWIAYADLSWVMKYPAYGLYNPNHGPFVRPRINKPYMLI